MKSPNAPAIVLNNGSSVSAPATLQIDVTATGLNGATCTTNHTLAVPSVEVNGWWTTPAIPLGSSPSCQCVDGQCEGNAVLYLTTGGAEIRPDWPRCNTSASVSWDRGGRVSFQGLSTKAICAGGL
jgi:hypothetical protein